MICRLCSLPRSVLVPDSLSSISPYFLIFPDSIPPQDAAARHINSIFNTLSTCIHPFGCFFDLQVVFSSQFSSGASIIPGFFLILPHFGKEVVLTGRWGVLDPLCYRQTCSTVQGKVQSRSGGLSCGAPKNLGRTLLNPVLQAHGWQMCWRALVSEES